MRRVSSIFLIPHSKALRKPYHFKCTIDIGKLIIIGLLEIFQCPSRTEEKLLIDLKHKIKDLEISGFRHATQQLMMAATA